MAMFEKKIKRCNSANYFSERSDVDPKRLSSVLVTSETN